MNETDESKTSADVADRLDGVVINQDYPDPICQDCAEDGDEFEEVTTGGGIIELWVYCVGCDQETFHPTPGDKGL